MSPTRSRSLMRSLLTAASVALAAAIGLAGVASAHALLSSSDPAVGANLLTAPTAVTLTFTEAPDPRLSSIKVLDAAGASVTAGPAQAVAGAENALRVALKALPKGIYTVSWRTVSSVDGHTAAGSFAFGVGAAPPVGGESEAHAGGESSLSPVGVVGRWLLYAGLIVLLGAAFTGTVILAAPPLVSLILAAAGWLAALLGTVVVLADRGVARERSGRLCWREAFRDPRLNLGVGTEHELEVCVLDEVRALAFEVPLEVVARDRLVIEFPDARGTNDSHRRQR